MGPARRVPGSGRATSSAERPPRGDRRRPARSSTSTRYRRTGDWPQWFMVDRYRDVRAPDSHGDIVIWPIKALCDYLEASGDLSILDTRGRLRGCRHAKSRYRARRPRSGRSRDRAPVRIPGPRCRSRPRRLGGHAPARRPGARASGSSAPGPSSSRTRRSAATGLALCGAAGRRIARWSTAWRDLCARMRADFNGLPRARRRRCGARRASGRTVLGPSSTRSTADRRPLPADPDDPGRHQRHVHPGPGARPHRDRAPAPVVSRRRAPDGPADGLPRRHRDAASGGPSRPPRSDARSVSSTSTPTCATSRR